MKQLDRPEPTPFPLVHAHEDEPGAISNDAGGAGGPLPPGAEAREQVAVLELAEPLIEPAGAPMSEPMSEPSSPFSEPVTVRRAVRPPPVEAHGAPGAGDEAQSPSSAEDYARAILSAPPDSTRAAERARREHEEALDDLHQLESLGPPAPSTLPPGAEDVARLGGPIFQSSLPPGPMIVPVLEERGAPPAAQPSETPAPFATEAAMPPPSAVAPYVAGGRRMVRPLIALLAVAAVGLLLVDRGGREHVGPTPASAPPPAAAPASLPGGVVHGEAIAPTADLQPMPVAPNTTPIELPRVELAEAATPTARRMPRVGGAPPAAAPARAAALPAAVERPAAEPVEGPPPAPRLGGASPETAEPQALPPFDRASAERAMADGELRAHACATSYEPNEGAAGGEVSVTFAASGRVTSALVAGSRLSGRLEGSCVARIFRDLRIPAFSGDPVTVRKRILIH
jgi:hypothetical protein